MQCYENVDSGGFDICKVQASSLKEMYEICRYIPYAKGFNSLGWVKYHINSTLTPSLGNNLYVLDIDDKKYISDTFPEIWVINLERRQDRKQKMVESGLPLNFFKAVDGKELTMTDEIKKLFEGNDFNYRRAVIGAALSHYNLWKQLTISKHKEYLIIEDDVEFAENFLFKYSHVCNQLQYIKDWDICYLGWSLYEYQKQHIASELWNDKFPEIVPFDNRRFYGAGFFGYLVSKQGAEKLCKYISKNGITQAIDCIPQKIEGFNRYFMFPHIIRTPCYGPGNEHIDTDIQTDYSFLS